MTAVTSAPMYLVPCRADDGADASSRRLDAMRSPPDQLSSALESVVVNFAGMVRRVAWRTRLSDADVDEVMQEVRIRLWRAHQGDDGASERIASAPARHGATSPRLPSRHRSSSPWGSG